MPWGIRSCALWGVGTAGIVGATLTLSLALGEPPQVTVEVDRGHVVARSHLSLGVTNTQHTLDPWGDRRALDRGKRLLRSVAGYQNQHIYGWGTLNPEPSPGVFRWRTLDRRIAQMRVLGTTPVITLCCAPDWMTRRQTQTSSFPNLPPTRKHFADFAELARRVALRYPDVRHFIVWNEFKGFWDPARGNWDYEAYTQLYNQVYRALKGVRRAIRVGGPYLVIDGTGSAGLGRDRGDERAAADPITPQNSAVLDYWLAHKAGAQFIAIDRKLHSRHDPTVYSSDEYLRLTSWYGRIAQQLQARTSLPIWYVEDYFRDDPDWRFQAAGLASMLASEVSAGVSTSLRWGPQGSSGSANGGNTQNLFSDTRVPGGGRPFPALAVYAAFARHFGPGTGLVEVRTNSRKVEALASRSVTLLINRTHQRLVVRLDGRDVALGPYGVRAVRAP
ncbi:MAG: beta-glucosidase/6-phospho-beta-glucosidase/beta-galactosidase [Solirubrobacterales bacterium]|nr:beta-glucosidase/6-phospho-beta-glucosidase/beta-galactosidase [Solirubrobacterales bacterium]